MAALSWIGLLQKQGGKLHGLQSLSVFVGAHVAAGDLIDQDDLLAVETELKFDIVEFRTGFFPPLPLQSR